MGDLFILWSLSYCLVSFATFQIHGLVLDDANIHYLVWSPPFYGTFSTLAYGPCAWLLLDCPTISSLIFCLVSKAFLTSYREVLSFSYNIVSLKCLNDNTNRSGLSSSSTRFCKSIVICSNLFFLIGYMFKLNNMRT